ncbi:hypothetical protein KUCAC02_025417 [Chaenocephalus aceratus]|uniref:Uncharacterized protein n=1 Tax=Chaenocephalus aceratus TaxID=36190 RepID=A0ACB9VUH4_CHAAC|nr:hypothetical protein KUCAC02_025417 [Chaenocephalus aceratus]
MMRYWGEIPGPAGAPPSRSSFDLLQREFRSVEMQDPPLHQPSAQRPRPTTMLDIPSEPCSLTIHTVQLVSTPAASGASCLRPRVRAQRPLRAAASWRRLTPTCRCGLPPPPTCPMTCYLQTAKPRGNPSCSDTVTLRVTSTRVKASRSQRSAGPPAGRCSISPWPPSWPTPALSRLRRACWRPSPTWSTSITCASSGSCGWRWTARARLGASPFPDVVEQVFHEVGIGSVLALQHFWQVRIKDYHSYMLQVSKDLSEEYERLVNPEKALEDSKTHIKEEPMSGHLLPCERGARGRFSFRGPGTAIGVLGAHSERLASGLDGDHSPHASGGGRGTQLPRCGRRSRWSHRMPRRARGPDTTTSCPGGDVFEEGGPMSS